MRGLIGLVAIALCCIPARAAADEYFAVTPSGQAEAVFDATGPDTSSRLASGCIDVGWAVVSTTSTVVVCEAPMNFGQSLLGTMLMGNSYSTPPRSFYRFNIATLQSISRVQASGWMELQMAFGQIKRNDFAGPAFHNGAINFMTAVGGRLPPGTRFPNHVYLGIQLGDSMSTGGVRIDSVEPDGPASAAGLVSGDVVVRLAGKRIKSLDDWLDATAKGAGQQSYQVEITRGGKKQILSLQRAFRPAVIAPIAPLNPVVNGVVEASFDEEYSASRSSFSPADELEKFARLKEKGIISDDEYDAMKKKILGL
jgi:hypothetical protein